MTTLAEGRSRGLLAVLAATAVAGASGYIIQILAAALLSEPAHYLAFSAFWSTLFLLGSAVGGIQQEVARATRPATDEQSARAMRRFVLSAIAIVIVIAVVVGVVVGPSAFAGATGSMTVALVVGLAGYVLTSVVTGLFYGLERLTTVAALIIAEAVLRALAVVALLLIGAPAEFVAFAIAAPFALSVLIVWSFARRRVSGHYQLDVGPSQLARNALHTVSAAAATGVMVTGMPLLFRISLGDASLVAVASLTLAVTLTRAPFIIPLMALQSFLVVGFRDQPQQVAPRLRRYLLGALAVAVVAAAAAWFLGPWVVELVSRGQYAVTAPVAAIVVVSAVLVGSMCLTGPALLAASRHRVYAAGWMVAAVATVLLLFLLPAGPMERSLCALVAAPLLGLAVHLVALVRTPAAASD